MSDTHYTDLPEYRAFLADIIAKPDDDLPRLVFCDWLEGLGDDGAAVRAEFIRVQVELAKTAGYVVSNTDQTVMACAQCGEWEGNSHRNGCQYSSLRRRERELFRRNYFDWALPVRGARQCAELAEDGTVGSMHWNSEFHVEQVFRRGFVSEVRCRLADWCGGYRGRLVGHSDFAAPGIGPEVVRRHPVERVVLTDRECYESEYDKGFVWDNLHGGYSNRPDNSGLAFMIQGDLFSFIRLPPIYPDDPSLAVIAETREDAKSALSAAAIKWAKAQEYTSAGSEP